MTTSISPVEDSAASRGTGKETAEAITGSATELRETENENSRKVVLVPFALGISEE